MNKQAYDQGFIDACNANGVDPQELVKLAQEVEVKGNRQYGDKDKDVIKQHRQRFTRVAGSIGGGIVGAMAGGSAGGPGGAIAGGVLGAGAGYGVARVSNALADYLGIDPLIPTHRTEIG